MLHLNKENVITGEGEAIEVPIEMYRCMHKAASSPNQNKKLAGLY